APRARRRHHQARRHGYRAAAVPLHRRTPRRRAGAGRAGAPRYACFHHLAARRPAGALTMAARHCLVIDDDADFRAGLAAALARRGSAVSAAGTPGEARALAARQCPDDVVLDLRLGDESGLELIEPLRAANDAVRIVVLTGYASITTAVQAIKLGAVHYLTKP